MTLGPPPVGADPGPDRAQQLLRGFGRGLAGAAVLIAVVTIGARLVGFLRIVVFARTVGVTCLGSTYYTANTVPNIVYEIVAGGALASLVVPVLAGPVERGESETASRIASALLSWAMVLLVPLALVGVVAAGPVMRLLVGHPHPPCTPSDVVAVGTRMLLVFLPQIVLYGIGIVLTGVLQAHRRFLGPALAPLLSSLVVIAAYLLFAAESGRVDLAHLSRTRELTLSVGTTLGVLLLSLSLLVPLRRTGLRLRPALRFPPGVARRVRRLALAGAATLAAQQISVAVVLRLANDRGPEGAAVLYNLAWTVFLLPWAVLAVPIATSAFPMLAARADMDDQAGYARVAALTTRAVLLTTLAAAAVVVAAAAPAARVLILGTPSHPDPGVLASALVTFAPGLVGYGLIAHLGRALYARGDGRTPAAATVVGWVTVIAADLVLVPLVPTHWRVAALGVGNSIGMTVAGALLVLGLARAGGRASLRGVARAAGTGVAAAAAGAACGRLVVAALGSGGVAGSVGFAAVATAVTGAVFAAVVYLLDGDDLRRIARRRFGG